MSDIVDEILNNITFPTDGTSGIKERILMKEIINKNSYTNNNKINKLLTKLLDMFTITDRYVEMVTQKLPNVIDSVHKQTITQLKKNCDDCRNEKNILANTCENNSRFIRTLNTENENKDKILAEQQANIKELESKISNISNDVDRLKKENKELTNINTTNIKKLEQKEIDIKTLNDTNKTLKDINTTNIKTIAQKEIEIQNFDKQQLLNNNLQFTSNLKNVNGQLIELDNKLQEANVVNEQLQEQLKHQEFTYHSIQQILNNKHDELEDCRQKLKLCEELNTSHINKITQSNNNYSDLLKEKYIIVEKIQNTNKQFIDLFQLYNSKLLILKQDIIDTFTNLVVDDDTIMDVENASNMEKIKVLIPKIIDKYTDSVEYSIRESDKIMRINNLTNFNNDNATIFRANFVTIFHLYTNNTEEINLLVRLLDKFIVQIINETVASHKEELNRYINENEYLKKVLNEPNYLAQLFITNLVTNFMTTDLKNKIINLEEEIRDNPSQELLLKTQLQLTKVNIFINIIYTLFQNEIQKDLHLNNVKNLYTHILKIINKPNSICENVIPEMKKEITTLTLHNQETKTKLNKLEQFHAMVKNYNGDNVETTVQDKFNEIIYIILMALDNYLTRGHCYNKYIQLSFEKFSVLKLFCKYTVAKNELYKLFKSFSHHIYKFICCAQFYKNLVDVINDKILIRSIELNIHLLSEKFNKDSLILEILNLSILEKNIETVFIPIKFNIHDLTLLKDEDILNYHEYNNEAPIVSIENTNNNLKSLALLYKSNMKEEKSWYIQQLNDKFRKIQGDGNILNILKEKEPEGKALAIAKPTNEMDIPKDNLKRQRDESVDPEIVPISKMTNILKEKKPNKSVRAKTTDQKVQKPPKISKKKGKNDNKPSTKLMEIVETLPKENDSSQSEEL
ncbi:hypothetical protein TCON_1727 [Astathelohania contejeani]|uniref:Viral A-type inclusion protein n=1 Tax=Astathelohania contejeani TaxID=164912 RepID=A0ABQ7HY29_9MICR|nr:hypothetical protein TCON_1727 [Thelohania contejeani]